jgi:hypothetical protein
MPDPDDKSAPDFRKPKVKKKLGLAVPELRLPHDALIQPESMPSQTPVQTSQTPVAPERDYHKVPNSLPREAVPAGLFRGKSKQLYDCLYALTRGAVTPVRTVRISRPRLMKRAGIGARVTFESNVAHLCLVGLINVRQIVGEHDGNEYEVFTPDEVSLPSQTSLTRYAQKLVRLVRLETSQTRHTSNPDFSTTSETPKTSFKTIEKFDDDELTPLRAAAREITGKDASGAGEKDSSGWREVAEVLATELRIAAGRTNVSSPPAFLAEHLRRRLWKRDKRELESKVGSGPKNAPEGLQTPTAAHPADCPDCFGTGMRYRGPGQFEGPVMRCSHERLKGK